MGEKECNQGKLLEQKVKMVEENSKHWWGEMKKDIEKLTKTIEDLPDSLAKRLDENINLKIENRVSKLETRFMRWFIGLLVLIMGNGIGFLIQYFSGGKG